MKSLRMRYGIWILTVCVLFMACGGVASMKKDWNVDQYYDYGVRRLEKKDYPRAIEAFQVVTLNFSGSDLIDDAFYHLGEAHLGAEEYPTAIVTFKRLIRDFPQSPFADKAQYQLAYATYKQSSPVALTQDKTQEAIRELQIFEDEFPDSELIPQARKLMQECLDKLAEKDYKIGHLYFRMNDWDAARLYFQEMIEDFPSSSWAALAQYEIAESYARQKNVEKSLEEYAAFIHAHPDHILVGKAQKRMAELKMTALQGRPGAKVQSAQDTVKTRGIVPLRGESGRRASSTSQVP